MAMIGQREMVARVLWAILINRVEYKASLSHVNSENSNSGFKEEKQMKGD